MKHLEGLVVNYDLTVRDSDNSVIQFLYGEDGLDISKSQLLRKDRMDFFTDNINVFHEKSRIKSLKKDTSRKKIKRQKSSLNPWIETKQHNAKRLRDGGFLRFCLEVNNDVPQTSIKKSMVGRTINATKLCHVWHTMLHEETKMK